MAKTHTSPAPSDLHPTTSIDLNEVAILLTLVMDEIDAVTVDSFRPIIGKLAGAIDLGVIQFTVREAQIILHITTRANVDLGIVDRLKMAERSRMTLEGRRLARA